MSNDTAPAPPLARLRVPRGVAMAGLATSMFLVVLGTAMVNLAGPAIRQGLGLSASELSMVASSYLVALAGLLLLGGRLADVLGARRVFLAAMAVYLAASVLCALALTGPMLIAGRIGQGIGAAALMPSSFALMLSLYTSTAERTRAMGLWGVISGVGSLLGVFFGGTLTDVMGWQSVFWAPLVFGVLSAIVVWCSVPPAPCRPGRFDVLGALTITLGISALAVGMIAASEAGWGAPSTLVGLTVGPASLAAFVLAERRSAHPLVPLDVFHNRPVVVASAVLALIGATLASLLFFLPLYQQEVLGMSALSTGLTQAPIALMMIVGSGAAPWAARRAGPARALRTGLALLLLGLLWLLLNPTATGFSPNLLGAFSLIGAGLGLGSVNAVTMAVRDSGEGEGGLLSALVTTAQQLGGAIGLAALAGVAIGAAGASGGIAFTAVFLGQCALVFVALALSFVPAAGRGPRPAASPRP
jgi:EmrB/QacA subfamily drug resistance transporter